MRFRKKPVIIEAVQFQGDLSTATLIRAWTGRDIRVMQDEISGQIDLYVQTLEGEMHASPGDWIIKGVKGEFYPCKPDIFKETYEPVL